MLHQVRGAGGVPVPTSPSPASHAGVEARRRGRFRAVGVGDGDAARSATFGPNTGSNWGLVSHVSVWDALTTGNCLFKGALSSSVTINVNDSLKIAAGALDLSVD